jgi:hypothetical protein
MKVFAVLLALAVMAGSASASELDLGKATSTTAASRFSDVTPYTVLLSSNHPIRHRRWHDEGDYSYHNPEYFATLGAGAFDPSDQPGNGLWVNGSLGSTLSSQIDLGIQASWYHRSTGGEQFVREGDLPDGTHVTTTVTTRSIDTNLVPLMGIVRVRIPAGQVEPYVGGGLGWEWLTINGTDDSGIDFSNDYDGFGAEAFGGVNIKVAPTTGLYGEAVWNMSTPKAEFFDPTLGQTVREEVKFDGLALHGGLRFTF